MAQDPRAVANYFLEKAKRDGRGLTPLQVIKLVYIAHGWHLALTDEKLIEESPQAWQYGPVITSLYHELKGYGNKPISSLLLSDFGPIYVDGTSGPCEPIRIQPTEGLEPFLDRIWTVYGGLSGMQLSNLTHQANTPWHEAYDEGVRNKQIDNDRIKEHYLALKQRNEARRKAATSQ